MADHGSDVEDAGGEVPEANDHAGTNNHIRHRRRFFTMADVKSLLRTFCWAERALSVFLIVYGVVGWIFARGMKPVSVCNTSILCGVFGLGSSYVGYYSLSKPKVRNFSAFHLFISVIAAVGSLVSVVTASMWGVDMYKDEENDQPFLLFLNHVIILASTSEGVICIMKAAFICRIWEMYSVKFDVEQFTQAGCSPLRTSESFQVIKVQDRVRDRATGCLMGALVGSALGSTYEAAPPEILETRIATLTEGGSKLIPIVGGGPTCVVPGQYTDDGELTMALARSLDRLDTYNTADVADAYVRWFDSPAINVGRTLGNAFWNVGFREAPQKRLKAVLYNSRKLNGNRLSNKCISRLSPLAIAATNWSEVALLRTVKLDVNLTNPNAVSLDAAATYAASLRSAIRLGTAFDAYETAKRVASTAQIKTHIEAAAAAAEPVLLPDGRQVETNCPNMGYVGIALQNAYHEILTDGSFESGMTNILRRGGDTDTNLSIAGAMLGAVFGYDAMPDQWVNSVLHARVDARTKQFPPASVGDFHRLVDRLLFLKQPKRSSSSFRLVG